MKLIISPVGTSTLTNRSDDNARRLLGKYANARNREEIDKEDRDCLDNYIALRRQEISAMKAAEAKKISAELHSLLILFEQQPKEDRDQVVLIPTDTHIGRITGDIIKDYLESNNIDVRMLEVAGLQTKSSADLHLAFSKLVNEIMALHEEFAPQGARIIFNLTGGFKAVQGFMQTLSTLYADETVYIFEHESELMRIPRLPFKLQSEDYITENLKLWRRLELGLKVEAEELENIPGAFYFPCNGDFGLADYGEFVWKNLKLELYQKEIYPAPTPLVKFGPRFLKSTEELSPDRIVKINRQLDELARYLETGRQDMLKSLSFKSITPNAKPGSTHEFYAWSDNNAARVYCHYDNNKVLILDELGPHL